MCDDLNRAHRLHIAELRCCADEKPSARNRRSCKKNHPKPPLLLSITVSLVRMRFISVPKTRLARGARNGRSPTSADVAGYIELWRSNLRGRRPVRADRRWRTDEKHIRAPSAILGKSKPRLSLLFIRTKNTVGAHSAQLGSMRSVCFNLRDGALRRRGRDRSRKYASSPAACRPWAARRDPCRYW